MELNFHHICIETAMYNESINFYTKLLGFNIVEETENFHGREYNTWLQNGNIIIELQTPKKRKLEQTNSCLPNTGLMHICFQVENLEDIIRKLESNGFFGFIEGKKKYKIMNSYLSKIKAPEGTIIELREKKNHLTTAST